MKSLRLIAVLALLVMSTMLASAADTAETAKASTAAYPLDKCIVSGEKLGEMGKPVVKTYNGREVQFCCNMCVKTFEKDEAKWMKKLDDAIVAAEKDNYPLQTCVVSGEKLGGMGEPYEYIYQNRLVRFCCGGCVKTFESDPAKYVAMIDAAVKDSQMKMKASEATEGTAH